MLIFRIMSQYHDLNAYKEYIDGVQYDGYNDQFSEQDGYHSSYSLHQESRLQPHSSLVPASHPEGTEKSHHNDQIYSPPPPPPRSKYRDANHDIQAGALVPLQTKDEQHLTKAYPYPVMETSLPETITLNLETTTSVDSSEFARAYGFDYSYPDKVPQTFSNHSVKHTKQESIHGVNNEDYKSRKSGSHTHERSEQVHSKSVSAYESPLKRHYYPPEDMEIDDSDEKSHEEHPKKYRYSTQVSKQYHSFSEHPNQPVTTYAVKRTKAIKHGTEHGSVITSTVEYSESGTKFTKEYDAVQSVRPPARVRPQHHASEIYSYPQYEEEYNQPAVEISEAVSRKSESAYDYAPIYEEETAHIPPGRARVRARGRVRTRVPAVYHESYYDEEPAHIASGRARVRATGRVKTSTPASDYGYIYEEETPYSIAPARGTVRARGRVRRSIPAADYGYSYEEEIPTVAPGRGRVRARGRVRKAIPHTDYDYTYEEESPYIFASERGTRARGRVRRRIPAVEYKSNYEKEQTHATTESVSASHCDYSFDKNLSHVDKCPKAGFRSERSFLQSVKLSDQSKPLVSIESSAQDNIPSWGRALSAGITKNRASKASRERARANAYANRTRPRERHSETCAGKHPALAVNELFPGNKIVVIGDNFIDNCTKLPNRYFVSIILPSHEDRMFYGVAFSEKLARYEACAAAIKGLEIDGHNSLEDHLITEQARKTLEDMMKFRNTVPWELKTDDGEFLDVVSYAKRQFDHDVVHFEEPILISINPDDSIFKAAAKIGVLSFMEVGSTAEEANRRLAWTIIKAAESKNFKSRVGLAVSKGLSGAAGSENPTSNQTIHDVLLSLVQDTIVQNTKNVPSQFIDFHDIAGILLLSGDFEDIKNYRVLTVAVGTNCINKYNFKKDGSAVHDSNAIVLAIRALRLLLFDELKSPVKETSVLEPSKCEGYKFKLKEQYQLVLATNHIPLGSADAMVKSRSIYNDNAPAPDSELCKIQTLAITDDDITCGCQVKYVPCDTSTNVKKHSIASPSDKITMYNVAGINGALLSQIIEPIYISSYSVPKMGNYYQSLSALVKSFHKRITGRLKVDFPVPYTSYKPHIRPVSFLSDSGNDDPGKPITNRPAKICEYSGWMVCSPEQGVWEVIKKSSGLAISDVPQKITSRRACASDHEYLYKRADESKRIDASARMSQLSKKSLFRKYKILCEKTGQSVPDSYFACKDLATNYHLVKSAVKKAFESSNLGSWPIKPLNTDCFQ